MKHRLLLLFFVLLSVILLSGCMQRLGVRRPSPSPDSSSKVGFKVVVDKREPTYLVAADRTSCTVSADRFRKVRVGSRVLCAWS
jgi:hypothetical protein